LNALYNKAQFWDGRARTLEEQASLPIVNPVEMGQPTLDAAVAKIAGIEQYKQAFRKAFGRPVTHPISRSGQRSLCWSRPKCCAESGPVNSISRRDHSPLVLRRTEVSCREPWAVGYENTVVTESRMSGAPDLPASGMLHVQAAEDFTLDAGTWHLTTDQHGALTAQISPPAVPMFQQVVAYLEAKPVPPGGNMRRADEARAGVAVCLRWRHARDEFRGYRFSSKVAPPG
jgi:hypothetical protein